MRQVNMVTLRLTPLQYQVVYEFLANIRLSDENKWTSAISELMLQLDKDLKSVSPETHLNAFLESQNGYPDISVQASNRDGVVFVLN